MESRLAATRVKGDLTRLAGSACRIKRAAFADFALPRAYRPTDGAIESDGRDMRQFAANEQRRRYGEWPPQAPHAAGRKRRRAITTA